MTLKEDLVGVRSKHEANSRLTNLIDSKELGAIRQEIREHDRLRAKKFPVIFEDGTSYGEKEDFTIEDVDRLTGIETSWINNPNPRARAYIAFTQPGEFYQLARTIMFTIPESLLTSWDVFRGFVMTQSTDLLADFKNPSVGKPALTAPLVGAVWGMGSAYKHSFTVKLTRFFIEDLTNSLEDRLAVTLLAVEKCHKDSLNSFKLIEEKLTEEVRNKHGLQDAPESWIHEMFGKIQSRETIS